MKKLAFAIGLFFAGVSALAAEKAYYGEKGTAMKYASEDYYGTYEKVISDLQGDFVIFDIDDGVHQGYFREYFGSAICEGVVSLDFNQRGKRVVGTWDTDSGDNCPTIGETRTEVFQDKPTVVSTKPDRVGVNQAIVGGTGCPNASVALFRNENGDFLKVSNAAFGVKSGNGASISERRKFCTLAVTLDIPQGWQYAITNVEYKGHANVSEKGAGVLVSEISFPFTNKKGKVEKRVRGPFNGSFIVDNTSGAFSPVWSQCNPTKPVNIKTNMYVSGPRTSVSRMSIDSIAGIQLAWRKCR